MELTGLYGITDSQLMPTDDQLLVSVEASLRGGTKIIQYRDKSNDADKRLRQACALVSLCDDFNVPCLINDDVTLAKQANATGVHLGRGDGNLSAAREFLGNKAIIGATCHGEIDFAEQAHAQGVDYIAFGAFFASQSKPHATPADINVLRIAKSRFSLPIVAIGGINLDNAHHVISAGADMIAVIHALYAQDKIENQARAFAACFN